jgi:cytochrome c oxidase assembly factor CtaG
MSVSLAARPAELPSPRSPRRWPWLEVVSTILALALAGLVGYAVYRHLSAPGSPILPLSWCSATTAGSLPPLLGSALLTQWKLDPIALVFIAVLAVLYASGVLVVRRSTGRWWSWGRTASFGVGLAVCGLATNSSIAVYDMALFSAHMIGHLMLVMLAPVLLCAGLPLNLLVAATAEPWHTRLTKFFRGRVMSLFFCPPVVLATYASVIVGSHLTGLMDQIMQRPWAGQLEHLVYILVGCQFFTLIAGDAPIRWQLTTPARWILLAISMAVDTFTGVILIMSVQPVTMTTVPGLTVNRLTDTHTGGAIMWVGGDGLMAMVMIWLVVGWLRSAEIRDRDRGGWLERVRLSTFATHTGSAVDSNDEATRIEFDDEDANREEYNTWLASLEKRSQR